MQVLKMLYSGGPSMSTSGEGRTRSRRLKETLRQTKTNLGNGKIKLITKYTKHVGKYININNKMESEKMKNDK